MLSVRFFVTLLLGLPPGTGIFFLVGGGSKYTFWLVLHWPDEPLHVGILENYVIQTLPSPVSPPPPKEYHRKKILDFIVFSYFHHP